MAQASELAWAISFSSIGDRGQPVQITSLFMIEVLISADGRVPKGRKNLTKHDKTRQRRD
jgi:hypothetical protein